MSHSQGGAWDEQARAAAHVLTLTRHADELRQQFTQLQMQVAAKLRKYHLVKTAELRLTMLLRINVQCSMFSCSMCSLNTLNTLNTLNNVQCSMFNVQFFNVFNVQCSMFNVQCSVVLGHPRADLAHSCETRHLPYPWVATVTQGCTASSEGVGGVLRNVSLELRNLSSEGVVRGAAGQPPHGRLDLPPAGVRGGAPASAPGDPCRNPHSHAPHEESSNHTRLFLHFACKTPQSHAPYDDSSELTRLFLPVAPAGPPAGLRLGGCPGERPPSDARAAGTQPKLFY